MLQQKLRPSQSTLPARLSRHHSEQQPQSALIRVGSVLGKPLTNCALRIVQFAGHSAGGPVAALLFITYPLVLQHVEALRGKEPGAGEKSAQGRLNI